MDLQEYEACVAPGDERAYEEGGAMHRSGVLATGLTVAIALSAGVALAAGAPDGVSKDMSAPVAAVRASSVEGRFVSVRPTRILDTRVGLGAPKGPFDPGYILAFRVTGRAGLPGWKHVAAVALTVTATRGTARGRLSVQGDYDQRTTAVSFAAHQTVSNQMLVQLASYGQISITNHSLGPVHVVVTVDGYFPAACCHVRAGALLTHWPRRIVDTQRGLHAPNGPIRGGQTLTLNVARVDVQRYLAAGVIINLTVSQATSAGSLVVYAHGQRTTPFAALQFVPGRATTGLVIARVSADDRIDVHVTGAGSVQVKADLYGWINAGSPGYAGMFRFVRAKRLLDTRTGLGATAGIVTAGHTVRVKVAGSGGIPITGVRAVALEVSALRPTQDGRVTVFPDGTLGRSTAQVQFSAHQARTNLVITRIGSDGRVALRVGGKGKVQLTVGTVGYYKSTTTRGPLVWAASGSLPSRSGSQVGAALSCATTTFCTAVRHDGDALEYNGTSWTDPASVDAAGLEWVQCPEATFCIAGDYVGQVVTYNGVTWSQPTLADPGHRSLVRASCASADLCMVLNDLGQVLTYANGSWTQPADIDDPARRIYSLTCPTVTFCMASDNDGYVATYNGNAWSAFQRTFLDQAATISCASPSLCFASAAPYNAGSDLPMARFDGTAWTAVARPLNLDGSIPRLSCFNAARCVAALWDGRISMWDGYGWTDPVRFSRSTVDLACPDATFCIVNDEADNIFTGTAR